MYVCTKHNNQIRYRVLEKLVNFSQIFTKYCLSLMFIFDKKFVDIFLPKLFANQLFTSVSVPVFWSTLPAVPGMNMTDRILSTTPTSSRHCLQQNFFYGNNNNRTVKDGNKNDPCLPKTKALNIKFWPNGGQFCDDEHFRRFLKKFNN